MTHVCTDSGAWSLALALRVMGHVADPARIQREAGHGRALGERDLLGATRDLPVRGRAARMPAADAALQMS